MFSDGKTKYHANNGLVLGGEDPLYQNSDLTHLFNRFNKRTFNPEVPIEESIINK